VSTDSKTDTSAFWQAYKDPRWQQRRLEVMQRFGFSCAVCLSSEKELHVHHKHYVTGRKPWEYEDHELLCVCKFCHEHQTELSREIRASLGALDYGEQMQVLGYIQAMSAVYELPSHDRITIKDKDHAKGVADFLGTTPEAIQEIAAKDYNRLSGCAAEHIMFYGAEAVAAR
jgi:predicted translin family RNA/ssDNA-binding protein